MTEPTAFSGQKILIAEDEFGIAMELQAVLERQGAIVEGPFAQLDQAQAAFKAQRGEYAAAIVDVRLRDSVATELIDDLVQYGTVVVIYTGTPEVVADYRSMSRVKIVQKPLAPHNAVEGVRAMLAPRG